MQDDNTKIPLVPFTVIHATAHVAAADDHLVCLVMYVDAAVADQIEILGFGVEFPVAMFTFTQSSFPGAVLVIDVFVTPEVAHSLAYLCDPSHAGLAGQLSLAAFWARWGVPANQDPRKAS